MRCGEALLNCSDKKKSSGHISKLNYFIEWHSLLIGRESLLYSIIKNDFPPCAGALEHISGVYNGKSKN
jgi:hypothetical protein